MKLIYSKARDPSDAKFRVSIAVRLKNERRFLPALIESLEKQTIFRHCELVFLDSGSTDGSIEYLREYAEKIYSIEPAEFQFGRSCNQIISQCAAKYVVLLSAHVVIAESDALEVALLSLERDTQLAAVYFRQKTEGVSNKDFSPYESLFLKKRFPELNLEFKKETIPAAAPISNAAAVIRQQIWRQTSFPQVLASEDVLWAKLVVEQGFKLLYLGEKSIVHNHCESPEQIYKRVRINKIAQNGNMPQYRKAMVYFIGIFGALLFIERTRVLTAFRYAKAHATAYVR